MQIKTQQQKYSDIIYKMDPMMNPPMEPMMAVPNKRPVGRPKLRGCDYTIAVNAAGVAKPKCSLTKKSNAVAEQCVMSDKGRCSMKKAPKAPKKPAYNGCMVKMGAKKESCVRDKDSDMVDERCMKNEKGRCSMKKVPKEKKPVYNGCMVKMGAKKESCVRNKESDMVDERCMKNEKNRCVMKKAEKARPVVNMEQINIPTLTLSLDTHFKQALLYDFMTESYRPKNMRGKEVTIPESTMDYILSRMTKLRQHIENAIASHTASVRSLFPGEIGKLVEKNMQIVRTSEGLKNMSIETVKNYLQSKLHTNVSSEEADLYRIAVFIIAYDLMNLAISIPMMTSDRTELTRNDVDRSIESDDELKAFM